MIERMSLANFGPIADVKSPRLLIDADLDQIRQVPFLGILYMCPQWPKLK